LKWAFEIANGLEHISLRKVIHADVACRNVLISRDGTAKLTDFGLSRQLYYKTEYLKSNTREKLAWRWMAVEALRSGIFSVQTDVWSFGVTLWEIFSLAEMPYPGVMEWGEQFLLKLEKENYRMSPPPHSTEEINELMQRCWFHKPSQRPSFTQLKNKLRTLHQAQLDL
jgi:serine/threonine protein kinase